MGKIKLSETLRFLSARLNEIRGGNLDFELTVDDEEVAPGEVIRARAVVRAPEESDRTLTCITISLSGNVQRDGKWETYTQRAETAHDIPLPGGHEYIIPIIIKIPHEAVLTEDGGTWVLRAQAVVDGRFDPRDEIAVTVVQS